MRIVIAACSVIYTGRGDTQLTEAVRAIIIKDDGAVSIHSDQGNKPLNYMGKGNQHAITYGDDHEMWNFDTTKESLQIRLTRIIADTNHDLAATEPGLTRDGTEPQLQAWLAANPDAIGAGYTLVSREYPTGAGPVDLMLLDPDGNPVAVEVKRTAMLAAVGQVQRYVESLKDQPGMMHVQGMIAALDIRPKTALLAEKRGIRCVTLPAIWRQSVEGLTEPVAPPLP